MKFFRNFCPSIVRRIEGDISAVAGTVIVQESVFERGEQRTVIVVILGLQSE